MTISKAYNLLVHDEILERRPGKPLLVADLGQGDLADRRLEQLAETLGPAVRLVRQLDLDEAEAVDLYRELLAAAEPTARKDRT
jgi:DNA-binding transcriptional regulator YhcF (GntR family)